MGRQVEEEPRHVEPGEDGIWPQAMYPIDMVEPPPKESLITSVFSLVVVGPIYEGEGDSIDIGVGEKAETVEIPEQRRTVYAVGLGIDGIVRVVPYWGAQFSLDHLSLYYYDDENVRRSVYEMNENTEFRSPRVRSSIGLIRLSLTDDSFDDPKLRRWFKLRSLLSPGSIQHDEAWGAWEEEYARLTVELFPVVIEDQNPDVPF